MFSLKYLICANIFALKYTWGAGKNCYLSPFAVDWITELLTWRGSQSQWLSEQTHHLLIPWSVIFWTNSVSYNCSCKNLQTFSFLGDHSLWGMWELVPFGMLKTGREKPSVQFSLVQLLSHIWLFVTPWTAAHSPWKSMIDFPVHHQILELPQTHVHCVGDAI